MYECTLCPRRCLAERETKFGVCRAGREMVVRAALPHFFEEPPVSGTRGSGTIFFAGCSLHCEYCQNREISVEAVGKEISPKGLAEIIQKLEGQGVHNINLVTGTHFADKIVESLSAYRPSVPVVWNTSGYESLETLEMLSPYVDIFLTDMKYADAELAAKYSAAADYPVVAERAIDFMIEKKPLRYGEGTEKNMLAQGVIVRHMVLPNALKNTEAVTAMFQKKWENRAILSLMGQYTPNGAETHTELSRPLKVLEYKIAIANAERQGLDDFFIQERGAVGKEYVPDFKGDLI